MAQEWHAKVKATQEKVIVYKHRDGGYINSADLETYYPVDALHINGPVKK